MRLVRVLIAEDDPISQKVLQGTLAKWGYEVIVTNDGREALEVLKQSDSPKLAILDWMMPEMDGPSVCKAVRALPEGEYYYLLLLTAKGRKEDIVEGLEAGADDYLTKPYELPELLARIRALLRRAHGALVPGTGLHVGPFQIDLVQQRVERNGEECQLTATEFRLFSYMAQSPGQVFTREELIEAVWGYDHFYGDPRTVDVHIRHLRQKLEVNPDDPQTIVTVRGSGYRLQAQPD